MKYLYNKINNISLVVNLLLSRTLRDPFIFRKLLANYLIEGIIYTRVISNNNPNLLYKTIILKNRKKNTLLIFSTIAKDRRKR
jgi:hypothetical protein